MSAEWVSAIAACIATIAGIIVASVGLFQFGSMKKSLKTAVLSNVLALEAEINQRKMKVDEAASALSRAKINQQPEELIETLDNELDAYLENWFNSVDRLAYCIIKGYWAEKDWKSEYREYVASLVHHYDSAFDIRTRHTNIVDIHEKWKRQ